MNELHTFINNLITLAPQLKGIYEEHLKDYNELLPHVFMGDVTRFVISLYTEPNRIGVSAEKRAEILRTILDYLEASMLSQSEDVQELIAVSFLENLDQLNEFYEPFKVLLGETLKDQLSKFEQ